MIFGIIEFDLNTLIIGMSMGAVIGFFSAFLVLKSTLSMERKLSVGFVMLWLSMITISFFTGKDVPNLFDFIGFGASGTLLGIDLSERFKGLKDLINKK